jgi:hypothetical protein
MFPDGWICRACWKPNRPSDGRCYVCKTPREQQVAVEAGSLRERTDPTWKKRRRLDANLGLVAAIVSWPMWLSGGLSILTGLFTAFLALISGGWGDPDRNIARLVILILAVVLVLTGMLAIFVSRSIRRQARWAYALAIVLYGVPAVVALLVSFPLPADTPAWYGTVETALQWLYLVLAFGAVLLLAASFMGPDDGAIAGGKITGAPS